MKNKTLAISILGVALGAAPILAAAEPPTGGGPDRGGERHLQRAAEYLGLSADQQTAWKSLYEQHKAETEPLRQEGRELHERLKAAMGAESPDPAAVGSATLALKQHRERMKAAHEAFESRLTSTLTPEQKTKFEAFKASHHGHGPGGGPHGRPHRRPAPEGPEGAQRPVQG